MVAKLSAMTSRSAAGMIVSIMVDLVTLMPNAQLDTAARFRRHVAMARDGVVCIGGGRGRFISYASTCEFAHFDLRV
jgi:hypothetical protein